MNDPQTECFEVLTSLVVAQKSFTENLNQLLVCSEQRMDRTNEMINKLSEAVSNTISTLNLVTDKYCKHLDEVCNTRDDVFRQNNALLESQRQMQNLLEESQRQNRKLIDTILAHYTTSVPPTAASITVNQQPQQLK